MPATPKRAGRTPQPGTKFLGQVFADNVRDCRVLRRLSQDDLAERMRALGHEQWVRATVSEVERYGRSVTIDEMQALALSLNATIRTLLEPTGVDGSQTAELDLGLGTGLPAAFLAGFASGRTAAVIDWKGNKPGGVSFTMAQSGISLTMGES